MSSVVSLGGVREAMAAFAASFDPALITAGDAAGVVADAARIEKMAATVKALAAARVADTGLWRRSGARSAAHDLARETGTSVGEARDALDTAAKLALLPALGGCQMDCVRGAGLTSEGTSHCGYGQDGPGARGAPPATEGDGRRLEGVGRAR